MKGRKWANYRKGVTMDENTTTVLRDFFPGRYYGTDKEGRPVYYDAPGKCDFDGLLKAVSVDEVVEYRRQLAEKGVRLMQESSGALQRTVDKITVVVDLEGVSRKNLKTSTIALIRRINAMMETEFPNLAHKIILIKAPAVFPLIYVAVSAFLGKGVKELIDVAGTNYQTMLKSLIEVDQLPAYYGGNATDESGSEKCEQHINYGGKIPPARYLQEIPIVEN